MMMKQQFLDIKKELVDAKVWWGPWELETLMELNSKSEVDLMMRWEGNLLKLELKSLTNINNLIKIQENLVSQHF